MNFKFKYENICALAPLCLIVEKSNRPLIAKMLESLEFANNGFLVKSMTLSQNEIKNPLV